MKYIMVEWIHDFIDEPVLLYSEIDEERNELRKIEIYRNGTLGYANEMTEVGNTRLSKVALPSLEEIELDEEFVLIEITKEEFEKVWKDRDKQK